MLDPWVHPLEFYIKMNGGLNKMPCSKYEGAQRRLCFATAGWKNRDNITHKDLKVKIQTGEIKLKGGKKNMEYKNKKMYGERANRAEACCKLGYPVGYYNIGMDKDDYNKMMMKKAKNMKKMDEYHDMNGYKMKGKTHQIQGPEGCWNIGC